GVTSDISATQQGISQTMADLALAVSTLEERLGRGESVQPAASLTGDQLEARAASVISTPRLPAAGSQNASSVRQICDHLRDLQQRLADLQGQQRTLMVQQRAIGGALGDSDNSIIALKQSIVGAQYDQYDSVHNEAAALRRTSLLGVGASLV